jgi:repressor LexA
MRPVATPDLTERETKVLAIIEAWFAKHGQSPTATELMAAMGMTSSKAMMAHLGALQEKGFIRRKMLKERGIEVVKTLGWKAN